MSGWRFEQRRREALARAARRGTLHTVQTPQGPLRADSPTISHLARLLGARDGLNAVVSPGIKRSRP